MSDSGQTGSIITLYEIIRSEDTADRGKSLFFLIIEFHECDEIIVKKALDVLVKQGKATIFASNDGNVGIKFL